jgi:phospholipid/cholesterol/gamma-HCH transport system substrate-binding protein
MPRTRSLAWSELKIGILAVIAISLAAILIVAVGGAAGFSWQRYELKTKFPDVMGLKSGAVVRVAGVEVGKVTDIEFAGAEVQVALQVKTEMQPYITTDSRATIGSLSLLGEPVIDVSPATTGTPLKNHDFLLAQRPRGQLADVAEGATQGLEQATLLLRDIRSGKGTVGKLFTDEQLYREFDSFVSAANQVASELNRGRGTLGLLMKDPVAYRRLNASLENLQDMTARINAGEGSLGKLLKDEQLSKSLTSASGNIDQFSARLNRGDNTVGKLLTEKELYERLTSVTQHLDQLAKNLNQGEGTVGQALHNKELYDNMNGAANELRALIQEIRKDPKKYLNVKVSIF